MKKYFLCFVILILNLGDTKAQIKFVNCKADSLNYDSLRAFLPRLSKDFMNFDIFDYVVLNRNSDRDCFCNLLFYAPVFDYLLSQDLDVHFDLVNNPRINDSSINLLIRSVEEIEKEREEKRKKRAQDTKKYSVFYNFLEYKKYYEIFVVRAYSLDKKRSLSDDVSNIIKYGNFSNPVMLKNILMSKYEDISMDNISKEFGKKINEH